MNKFAINVQYKRKTFQLVYHVIISRHLKQIHTVILRQLISRPIQTNFH